MSAGFAANLLSVSVTFAESFPEMFRVLLLSLNRDQKRYGLTPRLEQMESRYLERLVRNIRLMELRRVLNFSTRYSVGVGDFLILRRREFFFLTLCSIVEFIQGT